MTLVVIVMLGDCCSYCHAGPVPTVLPVSLRNRWLLWRNVRVSDNLAKVRVRIRARVSVRVRVSARVRIGVRVTGTATITVTFTVTVTVRVRVTFRVTVRVRVMNKYLASSVKVPNQDPAPPKESCGRVTGIRIQGRSRGRVTRVRVKVSLLEQNMVG